MGLTQKEAVAKYTSNWWADKTSKEIVDFQLYEDRLCIPFPLFHEAIEKVLNRPVFTHEFADQKALQEEYEGKREYDGLIPSVKRVAGDKPIMLLNPETGNVTDITPELKRKTK